MLLLVELNKAGLSRMTIRRSRGCLLLYSPNHAEKKTGMYIIGSSMSLNGLNSAPTFPCRFSKVGTDNATSYHFLSSLSSVILQYCKCCQNAVRQVLRKLTIEKGCVFSRPRNVVSLARATNIDDRSILKILIGIY